MTVMRFHDIWSKATVDASGEPSAARLRAAQIAEVRRHTPWMMASATFNALVVIAIPGSQTNILALAVWAAIILGINAWFYLDWRRSSRTPPRLSVSPRGIRGIVVNAIVVALL